MKMTETKESTNKGAWCGRTGYMQFASTRPPWRHFCNDRCLRDWDLFNSQNWLNVKETNNGEKKN